MGGRPASESVADFGRNTQADSGPFEHEDLLAQGEVLDEQILPWAQAIRLFGSTRNWPANGPGPCIWRASLKIRTLIRMISGQPIISLQLRRAVPILRE
jgi:hypothetical protein